MTFTSPIHKTDITILANILTPGLQERLWTPFLFVGAHMWSLPNTSAACNPICGQLRSQPSAHHNSGSASKYVGITNGITSQ